jgi:RNA polymerase sigma-70 factor (ECF subfamily)
MSHPEPTRATLIFRVRDSRDSKAWGEFVEIYEPLVKSYCRKRGLQEADTADVSQEVLQSVVGAVQKFRYDRRRGAFRSWLLAVTHHKLLHFFGRQKRQPRGSGETAVRKLLEAQPTLDEAREWDRDYKRRLFEWAAASVRREFQPATWEAFRLTAMEDRPPGEVAAQLGMSTSAVYQARSRVTARLRERILEVVDE